MRQLKKFLGVIFLLLFTLNLAQASIIGVNRAELTFEDVLRNGYAEQEFIVSMGTEFDVEVFYEARGEIASWISFEPNQGRVIVNENNPQTIKVIAQPPSDARVDTYEGTIVVLTGPVGQTQGRLGTNVVAAFEIKVFIEITDTQILRCSIGGISLSDSEVGFSNSLSASVRNFGNVRIRPNLNIEVLDRLEQNVVTSYVYSTSNDVLPTATNPINTNINLDLNPGQYWARISSDSCDGSNYLTFQVLELGGIRDIGEFIRLQNDAWAQEGEIIPLTALFRNRGERVVSAQFKGVVTKNSRIVELIESDVVNVNPNELIEINMFFIPEESGQYEIKGRMHYNNQISFERGSVLNVNNSSFGSRFDFIAITFYTALIVVVGLVFLIFRKKKKKF
jgi:hypothetical protein